MGAILELAHGLRGSWCRILHRQLNRNRSALQRKSFGRSMRYRCLWVLGVRAVALDRPLWGRYQTTPFIVFVNFSSKTTSQSPGSRAMNPASACVVCSPFDTVGRAFTVVGEDVIVYDFRCCSVFALYTCMLATFCFTHSFLSAWPSAFGSVGCAKTVSRGWSLAVAVSSFTRADRLSSLASMRACTVFVLIARGQ